MTQQEYDDFWQIVNRGLAIDGKTVKAIDVLSGVSEATLVKILSFLCVRFSDVEVNS